MNLPSTKKLSPGPWTAEGGDLFDGNGKIIGRFNGTMGGNPVQRVVLVRNLIDAIDAGNEIAAQTLLAGRYLPGIGVRHLQSVGDRLYSTEFDRMDLRNPRPVARPPMTVQGINGSFTTDPGVTKEQAKRLEQPHNLVATEVSAVDVGFIVQALDPDLATYLKTLREPLPKIDPGIVGKHKIMTASDGKPSEWLVSTVLRGAAA